MAEIDLSPRSNKNRRARDLRQRSGGWAVWKRRMAIFGIVCAISFSALTGSLIALIQVLSRGLPDVKQLEHYQPSLPTKIYDRNGLLISSFYIEQRYLVELKDVPQNLIDATIAFEDKRFYDHWGLDPIRIIKALWVDLTTWSRRQGASTITQQLARNLFLSYEKSIARKVKEMVLAVQIEREYSKEEILQFYFNQVYYGHGAYGVEAAARVYFSKHCDELTLAECALLAGLPKSPASYSPFLDPEGAKKRRELILSVMIERGFINTEEALEAGGEEFHLSEKKRIDTVAPYFTEYIRRQLERRFGSSAVYRGGLSVYTTLDLRMQEIATNTLMWGLERANDRHHYKPKKVDPNLTFADLERGQIREGKVVEMNESKAYLDMGGGITGILDISRAAWAFSFKPEEVVQVGETIVVKIAGYKKDQNAVTVTFEQPPYVQGSLLAMDPHTGEILAMVGGYDFRESPFNRSYQSKRQPGSAFKIFLYTAAMDNGFTPADVVLDTPFVLEGPGIYWRPHNYSRSCSGPMTIRTAIEQSINIVAAKTIDRVGIETVVEYAHRMGVKSELVPVYSLALGSSDVTLMDMVTGFATIANYGVKSEPYAIRYIVDRDGNKIEEFGPVQEEVLPEGTASVMISLMEGVIDSGTAALAKRYGLDRPAGGKTGTTDLAADTWFIGFTAEIICGVWVGLDDHESLGMTATGESLAVPIWAKFIGEALEGVEPKQLEMRGDYTMATICTESGLLATSKCTRVRAEYFVAGSEPTTFCDMHQPKDFLMEDSSHGAPEPVTFLAGN